MIFMKMPTRTYDTYSSALCFDPGEGVWCVGTSNTRYYAWCTAPNNNGARSFFITKQLGVLLTGYGTFNLSIGPNGQQIWSNGSNYLYPSPPYGMVITPASVMAVGGPSALIDPYTDKYLGPAFYASDRFFNDIHDKVVFTDPFNSSNKITMSVITDNVFQSPTRFGVYSDVNGKRFRFGLPCFVDQLNREYQRSFNLDANDRYTYGDIHWDQSARKWVVGTYNSIYGWYEGSEPSIDTQVTFSFKKGDVYVSPEDPEEVPPNTLYINYSHCIQGSGLNSVLLGDFAVWR